MFNGDGHKDDIKLSVDKLKSALKWATQSSVPNLFFIADETEKLEPSVSAFLKSIPEQIIVPLVSLQRQEELQIPFSEKQTVVVCNLNRLITESGSIRKRSVIVHVNNDEIAQLADTLLSIKDMIPQITLRLRDAHKLDSKQIETYKKQLSIIRDVLSLRGELNLADINKIHVNGGNGQNHCPAGGKSVTVGPDGEFYACPAFFYAGMKNFSKREKAECTICGSKVCPSCEFLASSDFQDRQQLCNLYQAEMVIDRHIG